MIESEKLLNKIKHPAMGAKVSVEAVCGYSEQLNLAFLE